MTLKVIGAGFGRTGTDSMRAALEILGFGPCHHMFEVNANAEQTRLWRALAAGAAPDWDRLFAGYASAVDWPSAAYWRQTAAHFPDAKVILTWRDPEAWWKSFANTILPHTLPPSDPATLGVALLGTQVFGGRPDDRERAIATFRANGEAVRREIPAERLLVYEPGDGWEPLCAFLGVPVPEVPYPHRNTTAEMQDRMKD